MERYSARLRSSNMMKRLIAVLLVATPLAANAAITNVQKMPQNMPGYLPVPHGAAVILNTGSTNTSGYRIVVQKSGNAEYVVGDQRAKATVPDTIVSKFFSDLADATPLQELQSAACMKSVSFGTSVFVYWNHQRSPDLTCPGDARGTALESDAQAIAQALHIFGAVKTPVMRPLMPGEQHKPLPPASSPTPM
jgi:hypothetical protein